MVNDMFVGPNHGNLRAPFPQTPPKKYCDGHVRPIAMDHITSWGGGPLDCHDLRNIFAVLVIKHGSAALSLGTSSGSVMSHIPLGRSPKTAGVVAPKSKVPTFGEFELVKNCTTNLDPLKVRAVLFFYDNLFCCRKKRYDFPWQL